MPFYFRQFSMDDQRSSMRIGTDAILLGSWTETGNAASVLDIGTGCGVISLMLAQKCDARIDAIDIDNNSVEEASRNFSASLWSDRLTAIHGRLQDYPVKPYDLICTNPPFFRNSLRSQATGRNNARHDNALSLQELIEGADRLLATGGRFTIIIPAKERTYFTGTAIRHLLFLQRSLLVIPKTGKLPNRILMEFSRKIPVKTTEEKLTIRLEDGNLTPEYKELTKDYYTGLL